MESSSLIERKKTTLSTPKLNPDHDMKGGVADRQEKVPGFDQEELSQLEVLLIGAGGLGTEIGEGLVRKGVGTLKLCDHDKVELSNLNRQKFYEKDLYKNKAVALATNLKDEGALGTRIVAYDEKFQELEEKEKDSDLLVAAVDNNLARRDVAAYCLKEDKPAVFTGVSREADHGYVFIQKPGQACWGCALPDSAEEASGTCPGSPAVKDVLKLMGALALYSIDSMTMDRPRTWNYRDLYLSDPEFSEFGQVEINEDCPIHNRS